jgi:hypothetical protein
MGATLRALLCAPATEHGELVAPDVFSHMRSTFQALTVAMHERDPSNVVDSDADCLEPHAAAAVEAGRHALARD